MAAVGAKKKRGKSSSGWSWRLAGIALCAFFVLGVITGLSESGRLLAHRIEALFERLPHSNRSELIPAIYRGFLFKAPAVQELRPSLPSAGEAIALAEREDGFYQIDRDGRLSGPIPPAGAADLPVLSGADIEHASAAQLLEYVGELIRAEAALAAIVSEMRVTSSGEVHLYLDQPHVVIALSRAGLPLQLARAGKVLALWREHASVVGMIDMTVPDEAIIRPRVESPQRLDAANASRVAALKLAEPFQHRPMLAEAPLAH